MRFETCLRYLSKAPPSAPRHGTERLIRGAPALPIKPPLRRAAAQLARIGNNLDQLARHANSYRGDADAALLAAEVAQLRADLRQISSPHPQSRGTGMLIKLLKHTGAAREGQEADPDARRAIAYLLGHVVLKPSAARGPQGFRPVWRCDRRG